MDVKRLENIRDFIINEMDNNINKSYERIDDSVVYGIILNKCYIKIFNSKYTIEQIKDVFKDIGNVEISKNEFIELDNISFPIDQNIRILNRKRKLKLLGNE